MEGKKAEELNALEALLREDDAVMELNILSVLKRYISDRGNPATVVELLSDNYQGDRSTPCNKLRPMKPPRLASCLLMATLNHACSVPVHMGRIPESLIDRKLLPNR